MGDKKRAEIHFRVTDQEEESFRKLCEKLRVDRSSAARDAVVFFVSLGEQAPQHLQGPHLAVFIADLLSQLLSRVDARGTASPGVSAPPTASPPAPRPRSKRHKQ